MMKTRGTKKRSPHNRRTRGLCAALLFIFVFGAVLSLPATAAGRHKIRVDLTSYVSMASDSTDFNILYYGIAYCVLD